MEFIDELRADGYGVEPICAALTSSGCQVAPRTYRAWKSARQPAARTVSDATVINAPLSVGEAASRLGISRVTLSRVLHGHARISPNLAVRLEEAGVATAGAWLAMQSAHDLAAERATGVPKVHKLDHVA
jgi:addiction module HigA family antidote